MGKTKEQLVIELARMQKVQVKVREKRKQKQEIKELKAKIRHIKYGRGIKAGKIAGKIAYRLLKKGTKEFMKPTTKKKKLKPLSLSKLTKGMPP